VGDHKTGDYSELKPLIVIVVFMSTFIFITLNIPTDFTTGTGVTSTTRNLEYVEYWDAGTLRDYVDINYTVIDPNVIWQRWDNLPDYAWANLFSQQLDDGDGDGNLDLGDYHDLWLLSRYTLNSSEGRIYIAYPLQRMFGSFGWVTRWGWAEWYFNNMTTIEHNSWAYGEGRAMNKKILEAYWEETDSYGTQLNYSSFKVKMNYEERQPVTVDVHFSFNTSLYGDPQFAWDAQTGNPTPDDLWVLTGVGFTQARSSYDAWGIVEALLFFNVPQILEGTPSFIGYLLSVITWVPIVYISFILILRAIGSVFGGGGA
jgi:hypothetical protein